jgi:hypothetical protein
MDSILLPKELTELLRRHRLQLTPDQPHVGGERALLSPGKLVLMATTESKESVVVKYSISPAGAKEIAQEAKVRRLFELLPFSTEQFLLPRILLHEARTADEFLVSEFISQPQILQDYPLTEQFFMSLHALENQESFHATTLEHHAYAREYFQTLSVSDYLETLQTMITVIAQQEPNLVSLLDAIKSAFREHTNVLSTFDGYLVHADFVPHNFRIAHNQLYLLDYVSFRIANKYEAWARYVNFMEVHQPELARLLVSYLERDRNAYELQAFWLIRMYRAIFLLNYYCTVLPKTAGELQELTKLRITLWSKLLEHIFYKTAVSEELIDTYRTKRDSLRTETEKIRQRTFTKAD